MKLDTFRTEDNFTWFTLIIPSNLKQWIKYVNLNKLLPPEWVSEEYNSPIDQKN